MGCDGSEALAFTSRMIEKSTKFGTVPLFAFLLNFCQLHSYETYKTTLKVMPSGFVGFVGL